MFRQDFEKIYTMVSEEDRARIVEQINNGQLESECSTGIRQKWWTDKHHPMNEIPDSIYKLGQGTIKELHEMYCQKNTPLLWEEFIDYTRELVKQKIMV